MTGSTRSSPLRGDIGNPCDIMTPLVQSPDPRTRSIARHGAVPVFYTAAGGAHSVTTSVKPRWDGAG